MIPLWQANRRHCFVTAKGINAQVPHLASTDMKEGKDPLWLVAGMAILGCFPAVLTWPLLTPEVGMCGAS